MTTKFSVAAAAAGSASAGRREPGIELRCADAAMQNRGSVSFINEQETDGHAQCNMNSKLIHNAYYEHQGLE